MWACGNENIFEIHIEVQQYLINSELCSLWKAPQGLCKPAVLNITNIYELGLS